MRAGDATAMHRMPAPPRDTVPMDMLHITDLEAAINHWRECAPAGADAALAPQLAALAELYARMVIERRDTVSAAQLSTPARQAWLDWYAHTPDAPCIAICSTSQGDERCKGCGRSFDEVQLWTAMEPAQKRMVWRRITAEGDSWRFTRYAERAAERTDTSRDSG